MTPDPRELLQEALTLKDWGLRPFPLARKLPRCRWKHFQHRHPSDTELSRLFARDGVDGIGAIPGAGNPFAVRDYDDPRAYHRWASRHPDLATVAPTVRTGRGFHVWTRTPTPMFRACGDGEYRANGRNMVALPPTRHPKTGTLYEWLMGPPLGPSSFPVVDPFEAGFLPDRGPEEGPDVDTSHLRLLLPSSAPSSDPLPSGAPLPDAIRECVLRTLPARAGQRNDRILQLARNLADHVPPDGSPHLLDDALRLWWAMAAPVVGTKNFGTTRADFRRAWSRVLVPMRESRPKRAMRRAAALATAGGADRRGRLMEVCRSLARQRGGVFHLSVRDAGCAIGVHPSRAAVLLKQFVDAGLLVVVNAGRPATTARFATEYRVAAARA